MSDPTCTIIRPAIPKPESRFGATVSISLDGQVLAVGSLEQLHPGCFTGVIYIFRRQHNQWAQEARLVSDNTRYCDNFGSSLDLNADGSVLIVGVPNYKTTIVKREGCAYIYRCQDNQWTRTDTLTSETLISYLDNVFGWAVAINAVGDKVAISDIGYARSVHIYRCIDRHWRVEGVVSEGEPRKGDLFGDSIALDSLGNTLVVSSFFDHTTICASIYTCHRRWELAQQLAPENTEEVLQYGLSVSLDALANTLVISSLRRCQRTGIITGYVYVYIREQGKWVEAQQLENMIHRPGEQFSNPIKISADGYSIVIGDNNRLPVIKQVTVFNCVKQHWHESLLLLPESSPEHFGAAIDINAEGTVIVIGSYKLTKSLDVIGGVVYLYERDKELKDV